MSINTKVPIKSIIHHQHIEFTKECLEQMIPLLKNSQICIIDTILSGRRLHIEIDPNYTIDDISLSVFPENDQSYCVVFSTEAFIQSLYKENVQYGLNS